MKRTPKHIERPSLKSARPLTALQLNELRLKVKHSVLTPELLEKMASAKSDE